MVRYAYRLRVGLPGDHVRSVLTDLLCAGFEMALKFRRKSGPLGTCRFEVQMSFEFAHGLSSLRRAVFAQKT